MVTPGQIGNLTNRFGVGQISEREELIFLEIVKSHDTGFIGGEEKTVVGRGRQAPHFIKHFG